MVLVVGRRWRVDRNLEAEDAGIEGLGLLDVCHSHADVMDDPNGQMVHG